MAQDYADVVAQRKLRYAQASSLVYERKFDTALRDSAFLEFRKRLHSQTLTDDDKLITEHPKCPDLFYDEIHREPAVWPNLYYKIHKDSKSKIQYDTREKAKGSFVHTIISKLCLIQLTYMRELDLTSLKERTLGASITNFAKKTDPILLQNLTTILKWMEDVVDKLAKTQGDRQSDKWFEQEFWWKLNTYKFPEEFDLFFIWSTRLVLVCQSGKNYLLPRSYLLLIHNKIADCISSLAFMNLASEQIYQPDAYSLLVILLEAFSKLAKKDPSKFFKVAKMLDALIIGETIVDTDGPGNIAFLEQMIQDLATDLNYDYLGSDLEMVLKASTPELRHEFACCAKLMGHPLCNVFAGAQKVFERATEEKTLDPDAIKRCVWHAKKNFVQNYIVKHKKWPPVTIPTVPQTEGLRRALFQGLAPTSKKITSVSGEIPLAAWEYVTLEQVREYSWLDNYLGYLKDRTISETRSQIMDIYDPDTSTKRQWWKTRLILVYLMEPDISDRHVKFTKDLYNTNIPLEQLTEYLVIRLVPKEKELKEEPRLFGCKTYEYRAQGNIQEVNTQSFLKSYFDCQALVIDEVLLDKKMYFLRNLHQGFPGYKAIFLCADITGWNNGFRHEAMVDLLSLLDNIYGTNLYTKTQQAFQNTLFVVPDENMVCWWDGQSGGIEGLATSTWEYVFINQVLTVMGDKNIPFFVLVKGDDLRIVIMIPESRLSVDTLDQITQEMVLHLSEGLAKFGHTVKPEDCYGSSQYFSFSHAASIGRVELPQTIRKIQKCMGNNNALMNTLDEKVGSTFSNAHSASKVFVSPLICYQVALRWCMYHLTRHPLYHTLPVDAFVAILLIPSNLGGFPLIYLHNFYVRAESDLLAPAVGLYLFCRQYHGPVSNYMKNFFVYRRFKIGDLSPVLRDPYSLPIDMPGMPSTFLRQQVTKHLGGLIRNKEIKKLYILAHDKVQEALNKCLLSIRPFNPRLISALYSTTPAGRLEQFLRQFESGRSCQDILLLRSKKQKMQKIIVSAYKMDNDLQMWRFNRLIKREQSGVLHFDLDFSVCPAEIADNMRRLMYGVPVDGVTMPPLAHLVGLVAPAELTSGPELRRFVDRFTFYVSDDITPLTDRSSRLFSSGPHRPFQGYKTRAGTTEPKANFLEKNEILENLKTIIELVSWAYGYTIPADYNGGPIASSNLQKLGAFIAKFYTDLDLAEVAPFSGQKKQGIIAHHMRCPGFKESIVPNRLANTGQQILGTTDTHREFRGSPDHHYINFLHILVHCEGLIFQPCETGDQTALPSEFWAILKDCKFCRRSICELPSQFDEDLLPHDYTKTIKSMRLGIHSEQALKDAIEKFSQHPIALMETGARIPVEAAAGGIMHQLYKDSYEEKIDVVDRYGIVNASIDMVEMVSDYSTAQLKFTVSQNELKFMNHPLLLHILCSQIVSILLYDLCCLTQTETEEYLSRAARSSYPWYNMVRYLENCGVLRSLLILFHGKLSLQLSEDGY